VAELEQACFLIDLPTVPPAGCSRLYYGAEFCFWRLPAVEKILSAREWAKNAGWDFTLVTPVVGEEEHQALARVLQVALSNLRTGDEVLISDWGTLEQVRAVRDDLTVVVGRTLSGQKRGPRILDMTLNSDQEKYFQSGSWYSSPAVELLIEQGLARVELDNLLQGIAPLPKGLSGSLHLPYAMVTTSRNCPFRDADKPGGCSVACGETFTLRSAETKVLLYQDGNTQFLCNETLPANLSDLGIDRVVRHPQLNR
jgi:hypothetical protein